MVRPTQLLHIPRPPATPRPAATVLLLRDGSQGIEVLMTRRSMTASFAPGAYVFPGGGIDAADAAAHDLAHRRPSQDDNRLTQAIAAIRESFEELGILLARHPDGRHADASDIAALDRHAPLAPPLYALADRKPDHGPLAGLDAALAAEPVGTVLLIACDMPNVTAALLTHLLLQLDDVDAVVPKTERGYHPLCAVYGQSCRAAVQRRLDQGHLRMQDLLADLKIRTVDGPELASFGAPDSLLANVNTQAALDALESQQNH